MAMQHASDWDRDAALTTARILLEIKAVNFRPEEPYTFTSGWKISALIVGPVSVAGRYDRNLSSSHLPGASFITVPR